MNVITDPSGTLPVSVHTLRRTGHKAIRFEGWQMIEAIGASQGRHVWHDLNIYQTVADHVVVELIVHADLPNHPDICHVNIFDDLGAAASWLETYRTANEVPVADDFGSAETPLPWAMLQAAQLRQRIERIELDYRALLSEVFAALDLTDPADAQRRADPVPALA